MASLITRATYDICENDLEGMSISQDQLPKELEKLQVLSERVFHNKDMAEHSFPDNTAEFFRNLGRRTGYLREFAATSGVPASEYGTDIVAASVVHLFKDEISATRWITDVFVKQFEDNIGNEVGKGQSLVAVERLKVHGFYDVAVGIRAVQSGNDGLLSSTVIDFRIGCLIGVAFIVTVGDYSRVETAKHVGLELERNIVKRLLSPE